MKHYKKVMILVLVLYWAFMFIGTFNWLKADEIKDVSENYVKYLLKQTNVYNDFSSIIENNNILKHSIGVTKVISDEKLKIKLKSTDIELSNDNLLISWTKTF